MLLLYHDFTKNARTVFHRGMILCFEVGMLNDKIFYFLNFGNKKSLFSSSEGFTIVIQVGVFLCSFALLSFYRALEFPLSFPVWFLIVF